MDQSPLRRDQTVVKSTIYSNLYERDTDRRLEAPIVELEGTQQCSGVVAGERTHDEQFLAMPSPNTRLIGGKLGHYQVR